MLDLMALQPRSSVVNIIMDEAIMLSTSRFIKSILLQA